MSKDSQYVGHSGLHYMSQRIDIECDVMGEVLTFWNLSLISQSLNQTTLALVCFVVSNTYYS